MRNAVRTNVRDLGTLHAGDGASPTIIQSQILEDCSEVLNPAAYQELPDDWVVGITDVVNSRKAVREGRFADVNFAGAAVIAALANAIRTFDFPFAFAGDGTAFALPGQYRTEAEIILQQVSAFAEFELALELRTGLANVGEIRSSGKNVGIARHAVAGGALCYMFSGGGITWMENAIKRGRYIVDRRYVVAMPNLNGLSCEQKSFPSRNGQFLSLLVERSANTNWSEYAATVRRIIVALGADSRPADRAGLASALAPNDEENAALWSTIVSYSDFCRCDDRLRLTTDCSDHQLRAVERILREAARASHVRFGIHVQSHAIITCMVPSGPTPNTHLYFLDGYGGGYTKAAAMLNANLR
ncbi:DUF3095 domain-containing protein [Rhizobiaceae bacterium n13]|uniref:DUF3095 domain-containing protein n=1 Tax=Ferirhizobium litorale TaxID=2927786 RepID=A0AAE3QFI4_9HYPH|nr:DUF3095 family protein [Fererhizobium litorale]MDI7864667.1 DUF3095 domain-containing protein [Fererhizobium litorale]MDI7922158.1 DUF3095 domain-containing protein [Fererhizobium litorale]